MWAKSGYYFRNLRIYLVFFLFCFCLTGCSSWWPSASQLPQSSRFPTIPSGATSPQTLSKDKASHSRYDNQITSKTSSKQKAIRQKAKPFYKIGKPYTIKGQCYYPKKDPHYKEVGYASWYGSAFHGRLTANGEIYNMHHLSAAHRTLPLPSYARVTNLANGRSVIVRINDRGPYAKDRIIDLSSRAAELLQYRHHGVAKVLVEYISPAPLSGNDDRYLEKSFRKS